MKINKRYQSKHIINSKDIDWVNIQIIEKDICLLYHQLSEYSYIMDDLFFGDVYSLEYWNYLELDELDKETKNFIRNGCLVFIYAMVVEVIGGTGTYLTSDNNRYSNCKNKIYNLKVDNEVKDIINLIKKGFELIDKNYIGLSILDKKSKEIHQKYVRSYFKTIVDDFNNNSYFS